ncbi:hypothetical protein AAW14_14235 [Streptomyces hygroscopicus]|nr:hypothetical protein [Streptomyces hygroscopicus]
MDEVRLSPRSGWRRAGASEPPRFRGPAQKAPRALLLGVAEDLLGSAVFQDHAAVQEADLVRDLVGEPDLMGGQHHLHGGQHHRHAVVLQAPDDGEDLAHEFRAEGGGDLVQEQRPGADGQRGSAHGVLACANGSHGGRAPGFHTGAHG